MCNYCGCGAYGYSPYGYGGYGGYGAYGGYGGYGGYGAPGYGYGGGYPGYGLPASYCYAAPPLPVVYPALAPLVPRGEHRVGNCLMICQ